jgi:aspartyl protease family protein
MKSLAVVAALIAATVGLIFYLDGQYPGVLSRDDSQISLTVKLVVLVSLIGSAIWGLRRQTLGTTVKSALAWIVIAGALLVGYSFKDELAPVIGRVGGSLQPAQPVSLSPGVVALRATSDGHFHALADIVMGNTSARVRLMVDTGASDVALTRDDAKRLGIDVERLRFDVPYSTANGTSMGARVRLARLMIGDIAVDDVAASVMSGRIDSSLLGMSFLRRLSGFEFRGNEMLLRQ